MKTSLFINFRYTDEEIKAIEALKTLFGQDFIRKFCVLIFTHGEDFALKNRRRPGGAITFRDWYMKQEGRIQSLFRVPVSIFLDFTFY